MYVEHDDRLDQIMFDSARVRNQALYQMRKIFFHNRDNPSNKQKYPTYNQLYNVCKEHESYKNSFCDVNIKQSSIRQVVSDFKSFFSAIKSYNKDKTNFTDCPRIPKFCREEYFKAEIDSTRLRKNNCSENEFTLPKTDYKITLPKFVNRRDIRCVRIIPAYGKVKIEIVYEVEKFEDIKLDPSRVIAIDIGVNNLATITANNFRFSCIVNGRPLKSINQYYNKKLSQIQTELMKCNNRYTSHAIERLTLKRKNKILNYIHCATKFIIDLCVKNDIGKIVVGHNKGWKQEANMGKKNNQNFVSIPFNTFIEILKYKAEFYNIEVVIVEESYTSKTDHLMFEEMKHIDNRKNKRIKRGLFKSECGKIFNADVNGSIGILRKAKVVTERDLISLRDRGDIVSPLKFSF